MPEVKQNNKVIFKNTIFLYARMLLVLVVSLYTSRVVLNTLGVTDFGVYNVVAGFVTLFSFLNSSLVGAAQRFFNYENSTHGDEGVQDVFSASFITQGLLALIILVVLESFGIWYINNVMVIPDGRLLAANILFQTSIVSLLIVIMQVPYSSAIVSFEKMDYFAIVGIIDVFLKLAIVLVLPWLPYDKLISYAILQLLITITNFALYYFYVKKNWSFLHFEKKYNKNLLLSMLKFSGWNFFGTFSNVVYSQGLNLVLNFFFGPIVNAARAIATQVSNAIQGFATNITMAFRPQLVESYASGKHDVTKNIMFKESRICFLLLFLFICPVTLEIDYILRIWLGDSVPDYTHNFTLLTLVQLLLISLNTPFSQVVHAVGEMKVFQLVTGSITIFIAPVSIIFLKLGFDADSVFWVSIVMAIASQIACIVIVAKMFDYGIKDYLRKVIIPCLIVVSISLIMPLFVHHIMEESFWRLVVVTICSSISIIVFSYLLVASKQEKSIINTFLTSKLHMK